MRRFYIHRVSFLSLEICLEACRFRHRDEFAYCPSPCSGFIGKGGGGVRIIWDGGREGGRGVTSPGSVLQKRGVDGGAWKVDVAHHAASYEHVLDRGLEVF